MYLGADWTKLAAVLDYTIRIDIIDADYKMDYDKVTTFLKHWYNKHLDQATVYKIIQALTDIGRTDIVTAIG